MCPELTMVSSRAGHGSRDFKGVALVPQQPDRAPCSLKLSCWPVECGWLAWKETEQSDAEAALGWVLPLPEALGGGREGQGSAATTQKQKPPNSWRWAGAGPAGEAPPPRGPSFLILPHPPAKNNPSSVNKRKYIFTLPRKTTFLWGPGLSLRQLADHRSHCTAWNFPPQTGDGDPRRPLPVVPE